jgi:hypothetical protein
MNSLPTTDVVVAQPTSVAVDGLPVARAQMPLADVVCRRSLSIEVDPTIGRLLGKRWVVIALLAIAGPLGLPLLWLSCRFSKPTKIVTTMLFLLVTVVAPLAITYYWVEIALRPLVEAFEHAKP